MEIFLVAVILILVLSTYGFIYFLYEKLQANHIQEFRELARAVKAKDVVQYNEATQDHGDLPEPENQDEIVDLDTMDPIQLLKIINQK